MDFALVRARGSNMTYQQSIEPRQQDMLVLIKLYQQGLFTDLLQSTDKLLDKFPKSTLIKNLKGAAFHSLGQFDQAILCFSQVIESNPAFPDAYNNLGNSLLKTSAINEAKSAFQNAINLNPHYFIAHNNLGKAHIENRELTSAKLHLKEALRLKPDYIDAFMNLGTVYLLSNEFQLALNQFTSVLKIDPNFSEAYNNLGTIHYEMKDFEAAINCYSKAISLDPSNNLAKINLCELLKTYENAKDSDNPIIQCNEKIKTDLKKIQVNSDSELANFIKQSFQVISEFDPSLSTTFTQLYKRNETDLNCGRHIAIFEQTNIIPNFCFECFKVQIEVTTLFDLIKLSNALYETELNLNPTRKCMIELRSNIQGFYKAFIYCRGEKHAQIVLEQVRKMLDRLNTTSTVKVKRGCSEFSLEHPDFGRADSSDESLMPFPSEWHQMELNFDEKHFYRQKEGLTPSVSTFCLSDLLIVQHWIDYAKGLGDPTAQVFQELPIKYNETYSQAVARSSDYQEKLALL